MICRCTGTTLLDALSAEAAKVFEKSVRPLDYDFGLKRGREYAVLGLTIRDGLPWLYYFESEEPVSLSVAPAILFSFEGNNYENRLILNAHAAGSHDLDIVPPVLSETEGWFERYVDGDERIVAMVGKELEKIRRCSA
jgi:hypothetical protein